MYFNFPDGSESANRLTNAIPVRSETTSRGTAQVDHPTEARPARRGRLPRLAEAFAMNPSRTRVVGLQRIFTTSADSEEEGDAGREPFCMQRDRSGTANLGIPLSAGI